MTVLVTGGAGFIGSQIAEELICKGYKVRILDSLAEPVHQGGKVPAYLPKHAELIIGDVRDKSVLYKALEGVDIIFHQAAHQGYMMNYSTFFDVNSVGTAMLFEVIVEKKLNIKKIIIASSQAVYGEGKYICPEHGAFIPQPRSIKALRNAQWEHLCPVCGNTMKNLKATEDYHNPNTQYAMSKYTQEMIGFNLGIRHQIPVVCLRYSITLGKRQSYYNMYTGILRSFSTQIKLGHAPVIFEDGLMQRDYIHVDDVVKANMCVLENPKADYRAFNVGTGIETNVISFYNEVASCMKSTLQPVMNGEFRVGDVRNIVSSSERLQSLGWKPQKGLHDMIIDYLDYLSNANDIEDNYITALKDMRNNAAVMSGGVCSD